MEESLYAETLFSGFARPGASATFGLGNRLGR
jgi:hypothetical protein